MSATALPMLRRWTAEFGPCSTKLTGFSGSDVIHDISIKAAKIANFYVFSAPELIFDVLDYGRVVAKLFSRSLLFNYHIAGV